jgi:hypothetical protein
VALLTIREAFLAGRGITMDDWGPRWVSASSVGMAQRDQLDTITKLMMPIIGAVEGRDFSSIVVQFIGQPVPSVLSRMTWAGRGGGNNALDWQPMRLNGP